MNKNLRKECFGQMFPDDLHLRDDRDNRGKVFIVRLERVGGLIRGNRSVAVDIDEWDDCQKCPEFESCYKLCLARVTLESAIVNQ